MNNIKTTILGIASILAAVSGVVLSLLDGNPATNPDWTTVSAAIMAGWGLIHARDAKTTD